MRVSAFPNAVLAARKSRPKGGRRADLGNCYFRSAWEANYARYLNWLQARGEIAGWRYESEDFQFPLKRALAYRPDFKVIAADGTWEYHEVKGMMDQKSRTKLKRMAKFYPHVKVVLIDQACYRDIARKVGAMIEGWE